MRLAQIQPDISYLEACLKKLKKNGELEIGIKTHGLPVDIIKAQQVVEDYYGQIKDNTFCLNAALVIPAVDYSKVDFNNPADVSKVNRANKHLYAVFNKYPSQFRKRMFDHMEEFKSD